jgi:carbon monoxide dehydrogenase subunit G
MKIEQNVEVDAPLDRVWALVNDVPRIAPCMPGAQLTNVVDDRTYEGTIRVKLGPINMSYKGTAVLDEVDESTHSARLTASGKDVRGGGTARAGVLMKLEQRSETSTSMAVTADVQLTGKVASFGRGAIQDVSTRLFGQFAQCLRETLEEEGRAAAPAAAGAGAAGGDGGDGGDGGGQAAAPAGTATGQPGAAPAPAGGETVPSAGTAASAGTAGATAQAPDAGGQTAAEAAAVTEAETQAAAATAAEAGAGAPLPSVGTAPEQPQAQPADTPATRPRSSEPIQGGGLILTAILGLLKSLGAALVSLFRRLFSRS